MDSAERTATRIDIFNDLAVARIALARARRSRLYRRPPPRSLQGPRQQCLVAKRQQSLVEAHARAAAAGEDERSYILHADMIPESD